MKARATTTVDIHRDADTADADDYGDETETPDPAGAVLKAIPFSLIERTRMVPDANLSGMIPVSVLVGRCGGEHEVRRGDRVHDLRDGRWYSVTDSSRPQSPVGLLDRRLTLRRV